MTRGPGTRRTAYFLLACMVFLAGCGEGGSDRDKWWAHNPIDKTVSYPIDKKLRQLDWGTVAFNEPPSMNYGETRTIQLLLSARKSAAELEGELRAVGEPQSVSIQIAPVMEAKLSASGGAFTITPITPEEQGVSAMSNTEWKWSVRANELGQHKLNLSLIAKLTVDKANVARSVKTFDHDIYVSIATPASAFNYAADHWAITTGIGSAVIAVVTWLLRRRRPGIDTST